jgi:hypothetical protein
MATPARGATIDIYTIRANFSGGNLDAGWNAAYNTNMLNMGWYAGRYYYSAYYGYRYFPGASNLDMYTYFTAASGNCNCCCQCCCTGTCFLAGSLVTMADGTTKKIEDVKVGDYVMGAFGEANVILAKDDPWLGDRYMYKINDEHDTSDDHPHVSTDKQFYAPEENAAYDEWGSYFDCELADGSHEMWLNVGLTKRKLKKLTVGVELITTKGGKVVDSIEKYKLPPDTKLYNFVVGGSHTYFVNGYAVTGWPREDDFDYDKWEPTGKILNIDDYRKAKD